MKREEVSINKYQSQRRRHLCDDFQAFCKIAQAVEGGGQILKAHLQHANRLGSVPLRWEIFV